jgi:hypothetical protein
MLFMLVADAGAPPAMSGVRRMVTIGDAGADVNEVSRACMKRLVGRPEKLSRWPLARCCKTLRKGSSSLAPSSRSVSLPSICATAKGGLMSKSIIVIARKIIIVGCGHRRAQEIGLRGRLTTALELLLLLLLPAAAALTL